MSREILVELTNMCMVYEGSKVLVQRRSLEHGWPGVTFPGGHVEPGESVTQSVIREVREETGLTIEKPRLCGLKQFPEDDGTRYIVMLYKADQFSGELRSSDEGKVFWIKRRELDQYQLAVSFDQMIRVFEDDQIGEQYCYWDGDAFKRELL